MPTSLEIANRIYNLELQIQRLYGQLGDSVVNPRYVRSVENLRGLQSRQISILSSLIADLEGEEPEPPRDRYYAQHVLQPGETLRILALEYNTSVSAIRRLNPGLPETPSAGTLINLPVEIPEPPVNSLRYYVRRGDSLYQIAQRYNTTVETLVRLNSIDDPDIIFPGRILIIPNRT